MNWVDVLSAVALLIGFYGLFMCMIAGKPSPKR